MMDASEALQYMAAVLNDYEAQNQILRAENARLREALERVVIWGNERNFDTTCESGKMLIKARAALGKEQGMEEQKVINYEIEMARKDIIQPCGCTVEGSPIKYNPWNKVVQCHKCGAQYKLVEQPNTQIRALAFKDAADRAVAWAYKNVDHGRLTGDIDSLKAYILAGEVKE
jgi:hypothetical protein